MCKTLCVWKDYFSSCINDAAKVAKMGYCISIYFEIDCQTALWRVRKEKLHHNITTYAWKSFHIYTYLSSCTKYYVCHVFLLGTYFKYPNNWNKVGNGKYIFYAGTRTNSSQISFLGKHTILLHMKYLLWCWKIEQRYSLRTTSQRSLLKIEYFR